MYERFFAAGAIFCDPVWGAGPKRAAGHRVILAEERECLARFGAAYWDYMQRVRRYL